MKSNRLLLSLVITGCTSIIHSTLSFSQAYNVCQNKVTKKYGICYADTIRVPQIYDIAQYISSHEFIVAKDNKWGTINRYGAYMIDPVYDQIWEFSRVPNSLLVKQADKYGIVNLKGKTIVPLYQLQEGEINTFQIDAHLSFAFKNHTYQAIDKGKMAIFTMEGKMLFDFIYPFVQDLEVPNADSTKPSHYLFLVGEKGKYYFVDQKNHRMFNNLEVQNMFSVYHDSGNELKVVEVNGEEHLLNVVTGKMLNNSEMSEILEPFTVVQDMNDKLGAIDNTGKIRIPCIYDNLTPLGDVDYVITELNGKKGLINLDGEVLIEPLYEIISEVCFNGMDPTLYPYEISNGDWYALFSYDRKTKKMVQKTDFIYEDITCFEITKEGLKAYLTDSLGRKGLFLPDGKIQMNK